MSDPVIVASGQTYERVCIEKWLQVSFWPHWDLFLFIFLTARPWYSC
jgi:hypothetical protein